MGARPICEQGVFQHLTRACARCGAQYKYLHRLPRRPASAKMYGEHATADTLGRSFGVGSCRVRFWRCPTAWGAYARREPGRGEHGLHVQLWVDYLASDVLSCYMFMCVMILRSYAPSHRHNSVLKAAEIGRSREIVSPRNLKLQRPPKTLATPLFSCRDSV